MKKRKVKDFIALYAPEDEEKLVLIQSGTSADKTFLDTFWILSGRRIPMPSPWRMSRPDRCSPADAA